MANLLIRSPRSRGMSPASPSGNYYADSYIDKSPLRFDEKRGRAVKLLGLCLAA